MIWRNYRQNYRCIEFDWRFIEKLSISKKNYLSPTPNHSTEAQRQTTPKHTILMTLPGRWSAWGSSLGGKRLDPAEWWFYLQCVHGCCTSWKWRWPSYASKKAAQCTGSTGTSIWKYLHSVVCQCKCERVGGRNAVDWQLQTVHHFHTHRQCLATP